MYSSVPVIGIDFGLTKISASLWDHRAGTPKLISSKEGAFGCENVAVPAYISFNTGSPIFGYPARYQMADNPTTTVFDIKRFVRHQTALKDDEFQSVLGLLPFENSKTNNPVPVVSLHSHKEQRLLQPDTLLALIIHKLKTEAELILKSKVIRAVVSVPAAFTHYQRQVVQVGIRRAGINDILVITDVEAVIWAYEFELKRSLSLPPSAVQTHAVVIDFGGGHVDISYVIFCQDSIDIKFSMSKTGFAGIDYVNRILDYLVEEIIKHGTTNVRSQPRVMALLRQESERALIVLSQVSEAHIMIPESALGFIFQTLLTRSKFHSITNNLHASFFEFLDKALHHSSAPVNPPTQEVLLVGKGSKIPRITEQLQTRFKKSKLNSLALNPDNAIAYGTCIKAVQSLPLHGNYIAFNKMRKIRSVVPLSIGIEISKSRFVPIICGNKTLDELSFPIEHQVQFTTQLNSDVGTLIKVYEGNNPLVKDNFLTGSVIFSANPLERPLILQVPSQATTDQTSHAIGDRHVLVKLQLTDAQNLKVVVNVKPYNGPSLDGQVAKQQAKEALETFVREMIRNVNMDNSTKRVCNSSGSSILVDLQRTLNWLNEQPNVLGEVQVYLDKLSSTRKMCKTLLRFQCQLNDDSLTCVPIKISPISPNTPL